MELRNLRYFVEAARCRSITTASEKLFITQQALSKSIRSLEKELGADLFSRKANTLELTDYGKEVYPIAERMVQRFDRGQEQIRSISKDGTRPIRFISGYQAMETISPVFIEQYMHLHPEAKFQFDEYPDLTADQKLLDGQADFMLNIGIPQQAELFTTILIKKVDLSLMVGKGHPLYQKEHVDMSELDQMPIHCAGSQFRTFWLLKHKAKEAHVNPIFIPFAGYSFQTYQKVFASNGAIIGVSYADLREFKDVHHVWFCDPELNWNIYFSMLRDHKVTEQEQQFIDYVMSFKEG